MSLKAARINSGLTQTEAAKLVGIHPQTLSKYENDSSEIRNSLVKDLAKIYSIPVDYIFLGENHDLKRKK
ncbi:helix-turn-helix domain-containing protein [Lactococcus petauri]|nr:helix-turn-helix transcriptional regulator [Lactococcus petauri]MDG6136550.1 helix-turn-helix domain-containing protein [Lactococcus petauri]